MTRVPDFTLLTHPAPVLEFDLDAGTATTLSSTAAQPTCSGDGGTAAAALPPPAAAVGLELQGGGRVALPACAPTPVRRYAEEGACLPLTAAASLAEQAEQDGAAVTAAPAPNCAVYWLQADCSGGAGGAAAGDAEWLSTGPCPEVRRRRHAHWVQCVDFGAVPPPRPAAAAAGAAAGAAAAEVPDKGAAGEAQPQGAGGKAEAQVGGRAAAASAATSFTVAATWAVDRVRLRLVVP